MQNVIFNKLIKKNNKQVFTIIEISGNHLGTFKNLKKLVFKAVKNGADIIKFQVFKPDTITINSIRGEFKIKNSKYKNLYSLYKKAFTPWPWISKITKLLNKKKIPWFASVFDNSSVDFLETLKCPAYKIASPEITDVNLIEYVAKKKKPIILSTGLSTDEDLKLSLKKIKRFHNKFALLKCSTSYPASLDELNLNAIGYLKKKYKCPVGFSDHTTSELAAKVAVVLGATIIEKHFKLDDDKTSVDAFFSLNISKLNNFKKELTQISDTLGHPNLKIIKGSLKNINGRRSLYVVKKILKGETFNNHNIKSIRPANGMHPKFLKRVIGKKSKINIRFGTPLNKKFIKNF